MMHPLSFVGGVLFGMGCAGSAAFIAPEPMPWFIAIPLLVIGAGLTGFGLAKSEAQ